MKQGYKETELGWIPNNWTVSKLDAIGVFFKGKGVPKIQITDEGFNCLTYGDLYTKYDVIIKNVKSFISKEVTITSQEIKYGDICFSGSGETLKEIGKCAVYLEKEPGYAGSDIIIFRGSQEPLALSYILNSTVVNRQKYKYGQGHSVVHIYSSQLKNLQIPLPPLPEQKAIAHCLSIWDKTIESQTKLIKAKEKRKKALMQQLLTGKKRLSGFTEGWKEFSYSQLIKQVTRKEQWDDSKIYNLISVKRRSGGIFARQSLYGRQIEVKQLVKVKENDFLISKMQIVHGASSIVRKEFEDYYVSGSYVILNIKDENVLTPFYLDYMSKQKIFYHQTYIASYGVHIEKMTFDFKSFLKMKITLPSLLEQEKITKIIDTAEKEIQIEKQKLADLQKQRKGLMQQLLTGKVRLL